jgi:serine/arginine repetitive matrix protein 2
MSRGSVSTSLTARQLSADRSQEQPLQKSMQTSYPKQAVPTIRVTHATPHSAGLSSDNSLSNNDGFPNIFAHADDPIGNNSRAAVPFDVLSPPPFTSIIAPKEEQNGSKRRLVPRQKKSKLSLLAPSNKNPSTRAPPASLRTTSSRSDFSDVARRVGVTSGTTSGFDIYVDHSLPNSDTNADEVVMIKKKKSRAGLNGFQWGAMGEVTNIPTAPKEAGKSKDNSKENKEGSGRWWTMGRGRKESKNPERNENIRTRSKCEYCRILLTPFIALITIH